MFEYRPFVDQFLDYCRYHKKLSDKTVRAYKIDLSQYALFSDTLILSIKLDTFFENHAAARNSS